MNKIKEKDFNRLIKIAMNDQCGALRVGQAFYSALYDEYPDIATEIQGTKSDPFYVDENLYEFYLNYCEK